MVKDKIVITRQPANNDPIQVICLVHEGNSIEIHSDSSSLNDFYSDMILKSSIVKDVPNDEYALHRIVSSMYGGVVQSVDNGDITEEDFDAELKSLGKTKKIKV
jgi:hypothetical protein